MAILDLRPNCECCNADIDAAGPAYICSYECTYCPSCAGGVLQGTCPNCAGNLVLRPTRPPAGLQTHPASTTRVVKDGGCVAG